MLTDAQVERYSRQILLPAVGGRGQARLLAARVALAGAGAAAEVAATLLARAGIGALDLLEGPVTLPAPSPDCRVARVATSPDADAGVDLTDGAPYPFPTARPVVIGRQAGARAVLALCVGRPCAACLPADVLVPGEDPDVAPLAAPAALALGALAAGETLRALLVPPSVGRRHVLDLASGRLEAAALSGARGCPACGGTA